jgi:stage II sporulation protein P
MEQTIIRPRNLLIIPIALIVLFLIPAIICYSNMNYLKININEKFASTNLMVNLMSLENASFRLMVNKEPLNVLLYSKKLLNKVTTINLDDLRSFIGYEFLGNDFRMAQIIEEDYFPFESSPPLEVLFQERNLAMMELNKMNQAQNGTLVTTEFPNHKKIFIYHTHSWESYLSQDTKAKMNITAVGDMLGNALMNKGIEAKVDKTNISKELEKKGWDTSHSYRLTRDIVQTVMTNNDNFEYFIDLHRDSFNKEFTTKTLNNQSFAKLAFVIGEENKQYEQNYQFAEFIHQFLENNYPGVSRGILGKSGDGVDGVYNQDLSPHALVVEVGGVDNNIIEIKNSIKILAEAISQHYWKALEVNATN